MDETDQELSLRFERLERRVEELAAQIEDQTERFLDEDLKARGMK